MKNTNWLAVLVSVIASMIIGFLWYGALFNTQWMAGVGITMDGDIMYKDGVEVASSMTPMILNTIVMVIYALLIDWLIGKTGDTTATKGATLGFVIGFIMLLGVFTNNQFSMSPTSLTMIDGSYALALFTAIGAIMGGWRKK